MKSSEDSSWKASDGQTGLNPQDFNQFRDLLENFSGIHLPTSKQYLVATRLRKLMQEHRFASLRDLMAALKQGSQPALRNQVIDAMTTNETYWFRDNYPFQYFQNQILAEMAKTKLGGRLRVWCAACSSGQEPYSLAIIADEFSRLNNSRDWQLEIVATDISNNMLERCREGIYDHLELTRGMSEHRLTRYFDKLDGGRWRVKDELRQRINFRKLNLMESFASLGRFDVIFCRNVLIYFTAELKSDILNRLHQQLQPKGILFLGASEGLGAIGDRFEMVQCQPGIAYRNV